MEPVTGIIIKPVSNGCNLHCDYCYAGARGMKGVRHMTVGTAKRIVDSVLAQSGDCPVEFIWHGGEPLLRGKDFFEEVFTYQQSRSAEWPNHHFANALQTNITLLNDNWIRFFSSHGIQLSTSLDGPQWIHDRHRGRVGGGGSYRAVVEGIQRARRAGLTVNTISVITSDSVDCPQVIYHHLQELGIPHVTFLPCYTTGPDGQPQPPTPAPGQFGHFMNEIFDLYMSDASAPKVREVEQIAAFLLGGSPDLCNYKGSCHRFICVDWNGDVYACDTSPAGSEYRFGNILRQELSDILQGNKRQLAILRTTQVEEKCGRCTYWEGCHGGCPNQRTSRGYYFCADRLLQFRHIEGRLRRLNSSLRPDTVAPVTGPADDIVYGASC